MTNTEICEKIIKLEKHKKEHLDQYRKGIEALAESKSSNIFLTGSCSICDDHEKKIKELKDMIK